MMYKHTLYVPAGNDYESIILYVEKNLATVYGGFTSISGLGGYRHHSGKIVNEAVIMITCINGYSHRPDIFMAAAEDLKAYGEESVMMTREEIEVNFE